MSFRFSNGSFAYIFIILCSIALLSACNKKQPNQSNQTDQSDQSSTNTTEPDASPQFISIKIADANAKIDTLREVVIKATSDIVIINKAGQNQPDNSGKGIVLDVDNIPVTVDKLENSMIIRGNSSHIVIEAPNATYKVARPNLTIDIEFPRTLNCAGSNFDLKGEVVRTAEEIQAQKLGYVTHRVGNSDVRQDCSGIFNRFVNQMHKKLEACGNEVELPLVRTSSSGVAEWYANQPVSMVTLVQDPIAESANLEVGTVLFFSRNAVGSNGRFDLSKVNHMGVVARIDKDDQGKITSYALFHGHGREGTPADIDEPETWQFNIKNEQAPFGYASQHWIGYAPLVRIK